MKDYHITTKITLALDAIIMLDIIIQKGEGIILTPALGAAALFFCIFGQTRQNTRLGNVLLMINVIFPLWLCFLADFTPEFMSQVFYITIPVMLLFLIVQLLLCIKGNSIKIKLIPAYIISVVSIIVGLVDVVSLVTDEGFDVMITSLLMGVYIAIPGLAGILTAWAAYGIYKKIHP